MRKTFFLLVLIFANYSYAQKSCGSYVKNGKKVNIPCYLGNKSLPKIDSKAYNDNKNIDKKQVNKVRSGCSATITFKGKKFNFQHHCIVLQSGKTGALSVSEPKGDMLARQKSLKKTINKLAKKHGLNPALAHAVITVESAYRQEVFSDKGAIGLMQLMPETAADLGVEDPTDSIQNLNGGMKYLKILDKKFSGNTELQLAAYNAGPNAVLKYKNTIPPYKETKEYVSKVMAYFDKYQNEWNKYIR